MDCKNALVESNGDFEAAIDILRKKGQKIAAKRGENDAKEGLVIAEATEDGAFGVILALNCETDFVAKNDGYRALVQSIVDVAMKQRPASADALKALTFDDRLTVDEKITEQKFLSDFKSRGYSFFLTSYLGNSPITIAS